MRYGKKIDPDKGAQQKDGKYRYRGPMAMMNTEH